MYTPIPWYVDSESFNVNEHVNINAYIRCHNSPSGATFIAEMLRDGSFPQADAAHIVHCVNTYLVLVEALELAQATIERLPVNHTTFSSTQGTQDII